MKTEILSQEKNVIEAKAEFTPEEFSEAVEKTYKKISKQANIKGFRKGKIPRRALELYFPKESVYAETAEELVSDATDKMIEEYELKLIENPDVKHSEAKAGETFTVTVKFETTPQFELPDLATVEVQKVKHAVTDQDVEDQLKRILESRSELEPTYEERPLTKDDYVSVKYDAIVCHDDGKEEKVQEAQKTEVFLGSETLRPEMAQAMIGKKPGDKFSVEFPAEGEEAKADHAVKTRYDMEIAGIMKKKTPDLNDEFVAKISKEKTITAFKAMLRKQLEASAESQAKEELKGAIVNKLTEVTEIDIPEKLIDRQKDVLRNQQIERLKRENLSMKQFLEKSNMTEEKYEAELTDAAKDMVKRALILESIADDNDIECKAEEIKQEITTMAVMSGVDPRKLQDYVMSDRARLFDLADKIRTRKTLEFLVTAVKVTETIAPEEKKEEAQPAPEAPKDAQ